MSGIARRNAYPPVAAEAGSTDRTTGTATHALLGSLLAAYAGVGAALGTITLLEAALRALTLPPSPLGGMPMPVTVGPEALWVVPWWGMAAMCWHWRRKF